MPAPRSLFDFPLSGYYRQVVPYWRSPEEHRRLILLVDTRASAVLSRVFQLWTGPSCG